MNKRLLLFVLVLFSFNSWAKPRKEEFGRSFLFTRPIYQNVAAIQGMWHEFGYHERCNLSNFQVIAMYQQSFKFRSTQRYFLFDGKEELIVRGGDTENDIFNRDIRAQWLGIDNANFEGSLTVNPEQKQIGALFEFNMGLAPYTKAHFLKDFWVSISLPFVAVENNINFEQHNIKNPQTTAPRDLLEAFNQKDWKYARIPTRKLSTEGFAEIRVKVGRPFINNDLFFLGSYTGVVLPTAHKQSCKYMFSPVVGNNGHFAFVAGFNTKFPINRPNNFVDICCFLDIDNTFLIRNTQKRTVDLKRRPWSRYMQVNKLGAGANQSIPAVNVLTVDFLVRPFNMVDLSTGFRIKTEHVELEIGYNLWAHGDEELELSCPWEEIYGIEGSFANAGGFAAGTIPLTASGTTVAGTQGGTASQSTIKEIINDTRQDPNAAAPPPATLIHDEFQAIKETDLDLLSGATSATLTHKAHFSFSYKKCGKNFDGFANFGAFYEVPHRNTALQQWGIWAKVSGSF